MSALSDGASLTCLKDVGDRHRAATTGSTGFINLLLKPPEGSPKPRLNTGDRVGAYTVIRVPDRSHTDYWVIGNTPLHLAMESAHAEAACLLIEAGADRERVSTISSAYGFVSNNPGDVDQYRWRNARRPRRGWWTRAEEGQGIRH